MLRRSRRRSGATMVLGAISLAVILGVAAITLEGGLLLHQRRGLQAAADAAALAAADDLYANYRTGNGLDGGGTATAKAKAMAVANGYNQTDVTVRIPPTTGIAIGKAGYAEVIVQVSQPRGFSGLFGSGNNVVSARAVARGQWITSNNAIVLLDPTSAGALTLGGNGNLNVTSGKVVIDSNSAQAAITNGSNATLTAPEFDITGSPGTSGTGFSGTIKPGQIATPDPLAYLPTPATGNPQNQQSRPLSPGLYVGGIQLSGTSTVTMQPGVYYLQGGGFSVSGKVNLLANGVMIYNAPVSSTDAINISGQGNVTISPMTTGIYQGISMFQAPASTVPITISGKGSINITGTIYAAHATLNVTGNGSTNTYGSQYVTRDVIASGNGTVQFSSVSGSTARTRVVGLVE